MGVRQYSASRSIDASASTVWSLLTDATTYPAWNSSVISIDGAIREGNTIKLVSIADPKRTFKLKVAEMNDTFIHIADISNEPNPLSNLDTFVVFSSTVGERCDPGNGPNPQPATIVGDFRLPA